MPPAPPAPPAGALDERSREERGGRGSRRGRRPKRTPEEEAYREARAAAGRKMGFLAHAVPYGVVITFLLFIAGFRTATIVAMAWGMGLAIHYFFAIVAPDLRRRIIDREVSQRVSAGVTAEKQSLAGRQQERLEVLSASIAHEIRNPITAAKSLVQQMGEDPGAGENVEYAKVALEELQRVEKSVAHLLRFAREEEIDLHDVRMGDVVASALETFRDRVDEAGIRIVCDVDDAGAMRGDPDKLRRVLINLVGNAVDAFDEAGTANPTVWVEAGENLAGTEIWVRIKDNGPGMPPEQLDRIFQPFYTGKSQGTGLGLAISKKLVDVHGGAIEAHSAPGSGTEFVITFPKQWPVEPE
ncbi:MAG: HAMP domain-containing sensor histidine kinase [Myxococcota bacterium]|nr:HAMP domain-containing sensor histidine kinase [Myxococcota bacterium]